MSLVGKGEGGGARFAATSGPESIIKQFISAKNSY